MSILVEASSWLAIAALALATGCAPWVPEHDVIVTSDCRGSVQSARFRFPETDFEGSNCEVGACINGRFLSGDLEVLRFRLEGTPQFGPGRYELTLVPQGHDASEYEVVDLDNRAIWCGWYLNEELEPIDGLREDCYYAEPDCYAELDIRR